MRYAISSPNFSIIQVASIDEFMRQVTPPEQVTAVPQPFIMKSKPLGVTMADMIVRVNGEAVDTLSRCVPVNADTYDEIFNSVNAPLCLNESSVDGYVQGLSSDLGLYDGYSLIDHAIATAVLVGKTVVFAGKASIWCVEQVADPFVSILF
jgi:hypothetical protein